tara:strand:- start:1782 stop:1949 length:168 start_codon:yes stop_codon:yes gene_type:complete
MIVGSLVRYGHSKYTNGTPVTGLILYVNKEGGTLKVLDKFGNIDWFVTSHCEIMT